MDSYPSFLLKAIAPSMGKALHDKTEQSSSAAVSGSLFDELHQHRTPWYAADLQVPEYDAIELAQSRDLQINFLEKTVDPGFAIVHNLPKPASQAVEDVGLPMEKYVQDVVARINQHSVRATRYGVVRSTAEAKSQGADYNTSNQLSMHTDHSHYEGTPGYLQFMHQALGSVNTVITDGLAVAEYMRENYPEHFDMLSKVPITHGFCNMLYSKDGKSRNVMTSTFDPYRDAAFEVSNTMPVIKLNPDKSIAQISHSESKRGVSNIPYDHYHNFMDAYEMWLKLVEDARFKKKVAWPEGSMIVVNNWRVLHGRALQDPGTQRTMVFGYVTRSNIKCRYRLLKRQELQDKVPDLDIRFTARVDHKLLARMQKSALAE
jgi:alpha-ketoglutarate-dependent taurine dioxygenase